MIDKYNGFKVLCVELGPIILRVFIIYGDME